MMKQKQCVFDIIETKVEIHNKFIKCNGLFESFNTEKQSDE